MTLIIGIAGQMRTGKSSVAKLFSEEYRWPIFSFAGTLRRELADALYGSVSKNGDLSLHLLEQENKNTIRPLLQAWGQGRRDLMGENYWVHKVAEQIQNCKSDIVLIDDVRHPNEADYILRNGGILIRLYADESTLIERGADKKRLQHYSETAMKDITPAELVNPHRILIVNTSGMTAYGAYKRLLPFVKEMIE